MLRTACILSCLSICITVTAQKSIIDRIMLEEPLEISNNSQEFDFFDFSNIWMQTLNTNIVGIIGEDHTRIKIKLTAIHKVGNHHNYQVEGKSSVHGNICSFNGTISIKEFRILELMHYGVDDERKNEGIKRQGLLIADYLFEENLEDKHSGIFEGKLYSKFYINGSNEAKYDDIQLSADGYFNNAYIGTWKSYTSGKSKLCTWGDFRVPTCNEDFDIGTGEFSPSEKYYSKGWETYSKAWLENDSKAKDIELENWWK